MPQHTLFDTTVNRHLPTFSCRFPSRFSPGPPQGPWPAITIIWQFSNRLKWYFLGHFVTWTPNRNRTSTVDESIINTTYDEILDRNPSYWILQELLPIISLIGLRILTALRHTTFGTIKSSCKLSLFTFAKQKHHFADSDSDNQWMDLMQEIRKEVSLKHTGIKQEPYSAPIHDTHINQLQHDIAQLQTDIQSLKEAISTAHTQCAALLDTIPVALQQQLSKMKEDINHLQQMTRPNTYPALPENYRNCRTTDGLVICRRCNQVRHFARACPENLPPPRAPTHYQNQRHKCPSWPLPISMAVVHSQSPPQSIFATPFL